MKQTVNLHFFFNMIFIKIYNNQSDNIANKDNDKDFYQIITHLGTEYKEYSFSYKVCPKVSVLCVLLTLLLLFLVIVLDYDMTTIWDIKFCEFAYRLKIINLWNFRFCWMVIKLVLMQLLLLDHKHWNEQFYCFCLSYFCCGISFCFTCYVENI